MLTRNSAWTTLIILFKTIRIMSHHWRITTIMLCSLSAIIGLIYGALLILYAWKGITVFSQHSIVIVEQLAFVDMSLLLLIVCMPLIFLVTVITLFFECAAITIYIHELEDKSHGLFDAIQHALLHSIDIVKLAWARTLLTALEESVLKNLLQKHLATVMREAHLTPPPPPEDWTARLLLIEPLVLNEDYHFPQAAHESEKRVEERYGNSPKFACSFAFWDSTFLLIMLISFIIERILYYFEDVISSFVVFATITLTLTAITWMAKSLLRASIYQALKNRPTGIFDINFIDSVISK